MSGIWRQAAPVVISDDPLDEPLLERIQGLAELLQPSTVPNEHQKRDIIQFCIYFNKAASNLYSNSDMVRRIMKANTSMPYDMPGRLRLSTLVGTYMSGRAADIHPDDDTVMKLSHMYEQIMTLLDPAKDPLPVLGDHCIVFRVSDAYDARAKKKKGGSLKHKKKRPRPTNKRNPSRKRIRRRRSMKYKK
jgi:hypothetical protein